MGFADWKKRSKQYHDMISGPGIGLADAEEVAQAAYKAGERDGRKQVEAVAENGARLAVLVEREACEVCVPTNWCDPILTGKDSVIGKSANCSDIEAVLLAVRARIRMRSNAPDQGPGGSSPGPAGAMGSAATERTMK